MPKSLKTIAIGAAITVATFGMAGCAEFGRSVKTFQSDWGNGLEREIVVYDATGNELFSQRGRFDVEYSDERILYDDEDNLRHVIYFKTGTVVVNELAE